MKSVNQISLSAIMMAAAFLLAGCEKENDSTVDNRPVKARITSTIDGMVTRAAGTAWAPGDRIGIYAFTAEGTEFRANAPYVTTAGEGVFTADGEELYFPNIGNVVFYAYYPFAGTDGTYPGADGTISKTITAADQTADAQPKIDYLFAGDFTANSANPNVQFRFDHCMSRIVLNFLPGDGITALDDIEYTLSGILLAGTFNTRYGYTSADAATPAAPLTMSVPGRAAAELTSALILFPQQSDGDKTLTLTMRGTEYTSTFKFKENPKNGGVRELAAGHTYTYNVKINNTSMTISPATIAGWGDGGSENINSYK